MATTRSTRYATASSGRGTRGAGPTPTWVRWTWVGMGWAATALLLVWGAQQLQALSRAPQPGVECRLEWPDLPPSMDFDWLRSMLLDTAEVYPNADIKHPDLCALIGQNLSRSPWIANTRRISRQADGVVRVYAAYREPFAFVQYEDRAYLVDRSGVRLPYDMEQVDSETWNLLDRSGKPLTAPSARVDDQFWGVWFRIVGVARPPPETGAQWSGEDLAAGLALAAYLNEAAARGEAPFRPAVREIDVANYRQGVNQLAGRLRFRFVPGNYYIYWGIEPGQEHGIEAPAARKVDLLRTAYLKYGGVLPAGDWDPCLEPEPGKPYELRPPIWELGARP